MNHDLNLLIIGVATIPAFTLQERPGIKAILALIFLLAAGFSGKRIRAIPSALFFVGVVLVHLITPTGRVMFYLVGFPITEGSLLIGADKGFLIIGLVFLSRYAVRSRALSNLRTGSLLAETFACFEALREAFARARSEPEEFEQRTRAKIKLIDWVDDLLISVYQEQSVQPGISDSASMRGSTGETGGYTKMADRTGFAIAIFIIAWGSLVVGRLWPT